jgi:uncharacterized membrane protein
MSLYEAASFSADALAFSLSAIVCALLARIAAGLSSHMAWLWVAALLIAILSTIKSPLVALALPLVILGWRVSLKMAIVLGLAVVGAWSAWTFGFALDESYAARLQTIPGGVSTHDQMQFLLSHPLAILSIATETLRQNTLFYIGSGIGAFMNAPLAIWFYALALIVGLVMFVGSSISEPIKMAPGFRLALTVAGLIATALTFGTLYLTWTPVGSSVVLGVQGRYFIPVLAVLALSVSGLRPPRTPATERLMAATLLFFSAISFAHVVEILLYRYYIA